ncbi:MAG: ferritin family protein [Desulfomonilaceae bacterium]
MPANEKVIKIFEYALNQERTGLSFFQHSLQRLAMGAAVTAFKTLIQEEQKHIDFITRIISELKEDQEIQLSNMKDLVMEPKDYFDDRARSEFLERCIEGSMVPDVTVFNTAWLIEKDLSEYYAAMADITEGKAKQALTMLSNWEKEHEKFFREFRDRLSDIYALMPWGG